MHTYKKPSSSKVYIALLAPFLLMLTVYLVLTPLVDRFGIARGLLYGYIFYWGFWCVLFPLWMIGWNGIRRMFSAPRNGLGRLSWALLFLPVAAYPLYSLPEVWGEISIAVVLLSLPVAVTNGTLEELLWRGVYVKVFPGKLFLGYLFPSIAFGLWHIAPYAVMPDFGVEGAVLATIGGTLFGLCWGWAAWKTGSIRYSVLSHVVANFLAMGAIAFMA